MNKQTALKIAAAGKAKLLDLGFIDLPENSRYHHTKISRAGKVELSIRVDKRWRRRGWDVDIYAVFDDPAKARALNIDCNPYSGKYNFLNIETVEDMGYCLDQYR